MIPLIEQIESRLTEIIRRRVFEKTEELDRRNKSHLLGGAELEAYRLFREKSVIRWRNEIEKEVYDEFLDHLFANFKMSGK